MRRLIAGLVLTFAFIAPAAAQPACRGDDLVARMKKDEPQRYERLAREAAAIPFGAARMYRLSKGDGPPSYLFGTMHSSDPRALAWIDQIEPRLAEADIVAIENTQVDPGRIDPAAAFKMATMMIAKPNELLSRYLDEAELNGVAALVAPKMAMSPAAAKRLRPWALMLSLAYPDCESTRAKQDGVVDFNLRLRAETLGTPVQGLETIEDMLAALNEPAMEAQIDVLRSAKAMFGMMEDVMETMTRLLDRGETGLLSAYARDETARTLKDPRNYDVFMRSLLDRRNAGMFASARALVEQGPTVIAVGALHLPGEKGLAKMFADAGYKVEPVVLQRTTSDE
ncbi:MAG: hypothetical protein BGP06_20790 [Rhizobiales bacterium 65-9]|nr:TraB/GumN family protein [Hyphomicrobiales bacterium]OJY36466.1 MAG: hypothetical protein BGP06_20790 [Rhizobiales bacterium 65-9]